MGLVLLALLAGCGTIGLDGKSDTSDGGDTADEARVRIDGLDPDWGPFTGGTAVTVTGVGFQGDVAFWFGGTEVEVTVIDPQTLEVVTPEVHAEATVDVKVVSDWGEATASDGFSFGDGGDTGDSGDSGDSGDTGENGDTGDSGSGKVGGLVEFDYLVIGCPSCFGYADYLSVEATAVLHEPSSTGWTDWMPPAGSCQVDPTQTQPTTARLDAGGHVYLESGSSLSLDLRRQSGADGTYYLSSGLGQSDYTKNASWDLVVPDGGELGAFNVADTLLTTSGFDDLQPISMLEDGSRAFAIMRASAASFSWSPSGVSEAIVLDMLIFDSSGATQLAEIFCVSNDTGALTIPSSAFSGLPAGALAAIFFHRWQTTSAVSPADGSTIQGVTSFGALGTATLMP